jgi:hypothetical protein
MRFWVNLPHEAIETEGGHLNNWTMVLPTGVAAMRDEVPFALMDFQISTFRTNWIEKSGLSQ